MKTTIEDFNIDSPLPPTWLMFPTYTPYCIGWRMGGGEGYKDTRYDWFKTLTESDQKKYDELFLHPIQYRKIYKTDTEDDTDEAEDDIISTYFFHQFWTKNHKLKYNNQNTPLSNTSTPIQRVDFNSPEYKHFSPTFTQTDYWVDADEFININHYILLEKVYMFQDLDDDDTELIDKIKEAKTISELKTLERLIPNVKQDIWDYCLPTIHLNAYYYLLADNKGYRKQLLATSPSILVVDEKDNTLGYILMEVRDEIQRVYKNEHLINWDKLEHFPL